MTVYIPCIHKPINYGDIVPRSSSVYWFMQFMRITRDVNRTWWMCEYATVTLIIALITCSTQLIARIQIWQLSENSKADRERKHLHHAWHAPACRWMSICSPKFRRIVSRVVTTFHWPKYKRLLHYRFSRCRRQSPSLRRLMSFLSWRGWEISSHRLIDFLPLFSGQPQDVYFDKRKRKARN